MKRKTILASLCGFALLLTTVSAYAGIDTNGDSSKQFSAGEVVTVTAKEQGTTQSGSSKTTGTNKAGSKQVAKKSAEEIEREQKQQQLKKLIEQINEEDPNNGGNDFGTQSTKKNTFGDYVKNNANDNKPSTTLPDWTIQQNKKLDDKNYKLPSFEDLLNNMFVVTEPATTKEITKEEEVLQGYEFKITKTEIKDGEKGTEDPLKTADETDPFADIPDTLTVPTGYENDDPFSGIAFYSGGTNGIVSATQQVIPAGLITQLADLTNDLDITPKVPDNILTKVSVPQFKFNVEMYPVYKTVTTKVTEFIPEKIEMIAFDFEGFIDDWEQYIYDNMTTKPGENSDITENQFITNPNIDNMQHAGLVDKDNIPGTNIEVAVPKNKHILSEMLQQYKNELDKMDLRGLNITRLTIYQPTTVKLQTIHRSEKTNHYVWKVSGSGGSVTKETNSPYVKLLFESAGKYSVQIYNRRNVYRNNNISGTKTEMWVISNGGYYDGLVIYSTSTKFSGYVSTDIGPTVEQVELVKEGFTANVSESMLNKVQVIDSEGNILTPKDNFTTERK